MVVQKMNVLIPALHRPSKPTGVCRHAANLAQCLADSDSVNSVILIIGCWQKDYFESSFSLDSPKIKLFDIDIKNSSVSRNLWFMLGLPRLAQKIKPDIIHMSFPFPFVRRWFSAPVLATIHDLYPYESPENFGYPQVWFNQLFLQQCIRQSNGLVCVSKYTEGSLKYYLPQAQENNSISVIYNVVDFEDIKSEKPKALGDTFDAPFILSVAQHRKNKNLDLLIQAYDKLIQDGQLSFKTQLLLVGSSGPETESLHELVQKLNLVEQVQFLSGLEDQELRWLYESAELFVIPSSTEGFCLPLVEALALACPTVCSDIPIFREVGDLQCRYFQLEQDALHNLAGAIAAELSCPTFSEREADSRFSKTEITRQLLSFYTSFREHQN